MGGEHWRGSVASKEEMEGGGRRNGNFLFFFFGHGGIMFRHCAWEQVWINSEKKTEKRAQKKCQ